MGQFFPQSAKWDFPELNYSVARKAISDFKKINSNPTAVIGLQLAYVEYGVECTLEYGDIDESLNLDPALLEKSITTKTKAIIVQHTFGIPARIELIKKITQKHNILLIEDCAHSLGATVNGQKVGTFGDAAFFSFGRDKVLSSVFGGLFIINNKSKASKLQSFKEEYQKINYPSYSWIFQQLLHPVVFALILPLYNLILGKVLLFVLQKLKLLSYPVYPIEKEGGKEERLFRKYPNALAMLACQQLDKLERYNKSNRCSKISSNSRKYSYCKIYFNYR